MPERQTLARARRDKRQGKAPSTQAGEFVREEMDHIRAGKHGARSPQQAIAIGLSKARRSGVRLSPPAKRRASNQTRRKAARDLKRGRDGGASHPNPRRSAATEHALEREPHEAASSRALSGAARKTARRRGSASRSAAARKAARTRTYERRTKGARKDASKRAAARRRLAHARSGAAHPRSHRVSSGVRRARSARGGRNAHRGHSAHHSSASF
jgi:hypothetical protein